MIGNAISSTTRGINHFFTNLVKSNYKMSTSNNMELVFDTDRDLPALKKISNDNIRLDKAIKYLVKELAKIGKKIHPYKIKQDLKRKPVLVYRTISYDQKSGRMFDYYFIFDSRSQKVCCYKQFKNYENEKKRVVQAIEMLHDRYFMDCEEIYTVLIRSGFNITYDEIIHIQNEYMLQ